MFIQVIVIAVLAALVPVKVDGLYHHRTRHYSMVVDNSNSTGKEFRWGRMNNGDRLLYQIEARHTFDIITNYCRSQSSPSVRYGFIGKSMMDLDLPPYDRSPVGTIRYIEAIDMSSTRNGGYVCISRGGIGQSYVTLHLESVFNGGIDYLIRVYGS